MGSSLWRAMSVDSQFVGLAMNMSVRMETNLILNARLDTRDTKVSIYIFVVLVFSKSWKPHISQRIYCTNYGGIFANLDYGHFSLVGCLVAASG